MNKKITFEPESRFPTGYESLSEKEKKYFKIMNSKSGVLYITSPPGFAKSAIMRSIAHKMGFQYFDIRLSMVDETDVGLFPIVDEENIENKKIKMLSHIAPKWAYASNTKPSIIHFEELNRAPLAVRNAALQMLLEREIGAFFKFNDNVMMCASGNLGEEDGTDVEEFDQALNNRLIHIEHQLTFSEWVENYAQENICPVIIQFLKTHTEHYNKKSDNRDKNKAYATPRSWTFLSDYIFKNYGKYVDSLDENGNQKKSKIFPNIKYWINDIKEIGHGYIGSSNARFIRYCEDTLRITLDDILDRFEEIENEIINFNRDKKSEILSNMKERKVSDLTSIQMENLIKFLINISDDEVIGYLLHVLDNEINMMPISKKPGTIENNRLKNVKKFFKDARFNKFKDAIMKHIQPDESGKK